MIVQIVLIRLTVYIYIYIYIYMCARARARVCVCVCVYLTGIILLNENDTRHIITADSEHISLYILYA